MRPPNAGRAGVSGAFPAVQGSAAPAPAGAAADLARSFVDWLRGEALPFWARDGYDGSRARFCERLDEAGRPVVAMPHRLMVQARQVFVFAHAAHLGWLPEGAALAETAMESLLARYRDRPAGIGGFAFSVDADGAVVDDRRDAYGHAFVLFALAWLHRLDGDARWLAFADETIEFLDLRLADSRHGGMFDAYPAGGARKAAESPHASARSLSGAGRDRAGPRLCRTRGRAGPAVPRPHVSARARRLAGAFRRRLERSATSPASSSPATISNGSGSCGRASDIAAPTTATGSKVSIASPAAMASARTG